MANQQPRVQAVGVKNGKIAMVGSLDELAKAKERQRYPGARPNRQNCSARLYRQP